MEKVYVLLIICFTLFAGCQKKEEPPVKMPISPGSIQMNDEITFLKDAVQRDPENFTAWIELGNLLMDSSRYHEAIDAYGNALKLNPENVDVRVDMGTCYRRAGRPDKAAEEFRKAIRINPRHIYARRNLGVVLAYDLNDKRKAIKEFEEYLRLSPDTPDSQKIRQLIRDLKSESIR